MITFPQIRTLIHLLAFIAIMVFTASAQKLGDAESTIEPYVCFPNQNLTCANLNASSNSRFSHITENWQLKIGGLPNGSYAFTAGGVREVVGPQDSTKFLTISTANNPARVNSFSSQKQILAVIVKAGNDSYAFPYSPYSANGTNLNTGDYHNISHVTVCFGLSLHPSAANASVSGQVVDSSGRGIGRARISVSKPSTNETVTAITNGFGYYTVENMVAGELYIISVSHKRYEFVDDTRAFVFNEELTDVDFVGEPQ